MQIRKTIVSGLLLVSIFLLTTNIYADNSALTMLKTTTDQILAVLGKNKAQIHKPGFLYGVVKSYIVPQVDLNTMSMRVVGPACWNTADNTTKNEFKAEFTKFVVRTYQAPLADFDDDKIIYGNATQTQVNSEIVRKNGQRIPLAYQLHSVDGKPKIVDISVENVSLVSSYRAQFDCSNLKQLVQQLKQANTKK